MTNLTALQLPQTEVSMLQFFHFSVHLIEQIGGTQVTFMYKTITHDAHFDNFSCIKIHS